jgi:thioredoxin reductase
VTISFSPPVCIIGAGPYGLSIAAHLHFLGVRFRIFGRPMNRWRAQMPKEMLLKSEGCGSSLADPTGRHTLANFCAGKNRHYSDIGVPVSREIFVDYALSFQRDLVPSVEEVEVSAVESCGDAFQLTLNDGERLQTGRVIVATGLEHMENIPPVLMQLPQHLRSHSADHYDLSGFRGKDVAVIGGGQSALETAALLHEGGASVHLLVRESSIQWNPTPAVHRRALWKRIRYPRSGLGDGPQLWFYCNAPSIFRWLPRRIRIDKVKTVLGPGGGWWLKERIIGKAPTSLGQTVYGAETRDGRVLLHIGDQDGSRHELMTDHVIAATGYQFDVRRLPFLSEELQSRLRCEDQLPALSANFESTVRGLYFTGIASAYSFGPAMRFIQGSGYTARRITRHIAMQNRAHQAPIMRFSPAIGCQEL